MRLIILHFKTGVCETLDYSPNHLVDLCIDITTETFSDNLNQAEKILILNKTGLPVPLKM